MKRKEPSQPVPTAEEIRRYEREEHAASLMTDTMVRYSGQRGVYKDAITGPDGQKGTLETFVSDVVEPWMIVYGPLGSIKLGYINDAGHQEHVRCSRSGPSETDPKTPEEKGIFFGGQETVGKLPENIPHDVVLDTWEEWEPAIKALVNSPKAGEPSA